MHHHGDKSDNTMTIETSGELSNGSWVGGGTQRHVFSFDGDDQINAKFLKTNRDTARPDHHTAWGHHLYGGNGSDVFNFQDIQNIHSGVTIVGRIDDFDASQDTLAIDSVELDLNNLPKNIRIVEYKNSAEHKSLGNQQWLVIENNNGGKIFYCLEAARGNPITGADTYHFLKDAPDLDTLKDVPFEATFQAVPYAYYAHTDLAPSDSQNSSVAKKLSEADASDFLGKPNWDSTLLVQDLYDSEAIYRPQDNNYILGTDGEDLINGSGGLDFIYGNSGDDFISGGSSHDELFGGNGDDIIWGGSEEDIIFGGDGNDHLMGNAGDDLLIGDQGCDILDGGKGIDTVSYEDSKTGVSANLSASGTWITDENGTAQFVTFTPIESENNNVDIFRSVENLIGSDHDDELIGDSYHNEITGGKGNDFMIGGHGFDTFIFQRNDGINTIGDFSIDEDFITFEGKQIDLRNYAERGHITTDGSNIKIDLQYGTEIWLEDFSIDQIL